MARLSALEPIPPAAKDAILLNGTPIPEAISRVERPAMDPAAERARQRLSAGSRSVGPPKPLLAPPISTAVAQWLGQLPRDEGELSVVLMPHVGL